MSDVKITIKLPKQLFEQARAVGLNLEDQIDTIAADALEKEISRREAGKHLQEIAEQLQSLPAELKPTPEEIDAEIKAYRAEQALPDIKKS